MQADDWLSPGVLRAFVHCHFFLALRITVSQALFQTLATRIEALLGPICDEVGVTLYDVEVVQSARGGLVRVTVDRPGSHVPGHGVTVDDLAGVSRRLGYQLDLEDAVPFDYHLEVSSPGIERNLRTIRNWEQNVGQPIRVITSGPIDGEVVHEGRLQALDGEEALVAVAEGVVRRIPLLTVRRARTIFNFDGYDAASEDDSSSSGS